MKKQSFYLLFGLILLSLSSCFRIEDVEIKEIKSVKLLEFTEKGLLVESEIMIANPNSYDIQVVGSEFNVVVNKAAIGEASIVNKLRIPGKSSDFHKVRLRSSPKELASNAIPKLIAITASGKDELDFKVDGFIVGKVWLFKKKVDVAHEGKVDLQLF
jgi:LEA14-like dessication related protein